MRYPESLLGSLRGTQSEAKGTEAIWPKGSSRVQGGISQKIASALPRNDTACRIAALPSVARNDSNRRRRYWLIPTGIWVAAAILTMDFRAADGHQILELEETYIQGVFSPNFTPPPAGTYDLPIIMRVPPVILIDTAGRRVNTASLMHGKVAVVSFIYTACSDRLGCPLAGMALRELQALLRREGLQDQAVLVSISLDPGQDTPKQLAKYGRVFGAEPSLWHLLTAPSEQALRTVLESYGQDRVKVYDESGRFTGRYRHVLKVFLLDQAGNVRNIYSAGSLVPQIMVNDIKTVLATSTADRPN
ncbi:MAG: SCO family protein [Candidatus Methylomirabilis oxygeniifera]|uniref:Thioredoxin domain-containing protein n=1 Tax=Methylomirabilis oxygeniifera TaxID=671143 RepID=D5MJC2_METO1|nr:MAG: SCO family protein [Candidatus Methylomirabilis oxyfera]CBE67487.1 protein of unknown function [Candidatus Methylomirabilis oxyfera]